MGSLIIDEILPARISITQTGLSGTRTARAPWRNWPAAVLELMGTPVYFNGSFQLIGQETWPGIPTLLVDSVDVEGMGATKKSTWFDGYNCEFARLTINYKVPEFKDDKDENGDPATYLIESLDYGVEIAVVPVLVVDKADAVKLAADAQTLLDSYQGSSVPRSVQNAAQAVANQTPKKKTVKKHIRIPSVTYKVTMPQVAELPSDEIQAAVGRVNKTQIFGGASGTVLFDGPNAERESAFFTRRFWRVSYQFIYQPFGWNNVLHPDTLKWVTAKAAGSQNDPYESTEMRRLFPAPYRVRR